jgi:hypothetical protein
MKKVTVAVFIIGLVTISYAADPIKPILPQKRTIVTDSTIYTCPKQTNVRIVKTNDYDKDGWKGIGTVAGEVTVDVIAHFITPDKRMYCDYASPGSIGVSRAFPGGTTCTPIDNFSFACSQAK